MVDFSGFEVLRLVLGNGGQHWIKFGWQATDQAGAKRQSNKSVRQLTSRRKAAVGGSVADQSNRAVEHQGPPILPQVRLKICL